MFAKKTVSLNIKVCNNTLAQLRYGTNDFDKRCYKMFFLLTFYVFLNVVYTPFWQKSCPLVCINFVILFTYFPSILVLLLFIKWVRCFFHVAVRWIWYGYFCRFALKWFALLVLKGICSIILSAIYLSSMLSSKVWNYNIMPKHIAKYAKNEFTICTEFVVNYP